MKKMHFMIGAMGSGKSTVIRHLFVDAPYVHSLDELRLQAFRAAAAPAGPGAEQPWRAAEQLRREPGRRGVALPA